MVTVLLEPRKEARENNLGRDSLLDVRKEDDGVADIVSTGQPILM